MFTFFYMNDITFPDCDYYCWRFYIMAYIFDLEEINISESAF